MSDQKPNGWKDRFKAENPDLKTMSEVEIMAFMKRNNEFILSAQKRVQDANAELIRRIADFEKDAQ